MAPICSVVPSPMSLDGNFQASVPSNLTRDLSLEQPPPPLHIYTDLSIMPHGYNSMSCPSAGSTSIHSCDCKHVVCHPHIMQSKWMMAWNHRDGMTSCDRQHLKENHLEDWVTECIAEQLKNSEKLKEMQTETEHVLFTEEMFKHLLMKWIAVDDQSINALECPEFQE
ncbi:hypothetical protein EDD22DRAFT_847325 [Suillus occidentalis]|nr:hypothetical protein EDD22DRAFT_847325 [Suillus occidentalis]